jgi:enterochelin esterase-like enzyme
VRTVAGQGAAHPEGPHRRGAVRILIVIGQQDGLLQENQQVARLLEKQGFLVDFRTYPGSHTWEFWTTHLRDDGLVWWGKAMSTP